MNQTYQNLKKNKKNNRKYTQYLRQCQECNTMYRTKIKRSTKCPVCTEKTK